VIILPDVTDCVCLLVCLLARLYVVVSTPLCLSCLLACLSHCFLTCSAEFVACSTTFLSYSLPVYRIPSHKELLCELMHKISSSSSSHHITFIAWYHTSSKTWRSPNAESHHTPRIALPCRAPSGSCVSVVASTDVAAAAAAAQAWKMWRI
jgi:hypothetical protein